MKNNRFAILEEKKQYNWRSIDEIPSDILVGIKSDDIDADYHELLNILPTFEHGVDWIFELTTKFQPKTAALLLENKELLISGRSFLHWSTELKKHINMCVLSLYTQVSDKLLEIGLWNKGERPWKGPYTDTGYAPGFMHPSYYLPEEIRLAYYTRFNGLSLGDDPSFDRKCLLFSVGWGDIEIVFGRYNNYRAALRWYKERIPELLGEDDAEEFCCFLSTFRVARENTDDDWDLFVKTHIPDGIVYCVKGGDYKNTRILSDPAKAIDDYCHYILSHDAQYSLDNPFDFMPYTEEVNGRWGVLPDDFYEKNPELKTADIDGVASPESYFRNQIGFARNTLAFKEVSSSELNNGEDTGIRTKFGGQPDWAQEAKWPLSKSLKKPMRFIAQVVLTDTLQNQNKLHSLEFKDKVAYIFLADDNGEMVDGSYNHGSGENAVVIQSFDGSSTIAKASSQESSKGPSISDFESDDSELDILWLPELKRTLEPKFHSQSQKHQFSFDKRRAYEDLNKINKLGGSPYFVQGDEFPTRSSKQWNLVLQLNADDCPFGLSLGDSGSLYVFVNDKATKGSLCWQCA